MNYQPEILIIWQLKHCYQPVTLGDPKTRIEWHFVTHMTLKIDFTTIGKFKRPVSWEHWAKKVLTVSIVELLLREKNIFGMEAIQWNLKLFNASYI